MSPLMLQYRSQQTATATDTHTHTQLEPLNLLVAKADVLRFEDLSVGRFAADDDIQFVHRLHHSPGSRWQ